MLTSESLPVARAASEVAGPPQGAWTYDDYAAIPDDGRRYEILAGVLHVAPSQNANHQRSIIRLVEGLNGFIKSHGLGELFVAPFDVRLGLRTVVQPDLLFVSTKSANKVADNFVEGAPDLAVEIASPGTATYDRNAKLRAYESGGVAEYWIVDPAARTVELFVLEAGTYRQIGAYQGETLLPSVVLPGFDVPVERFFGPRAT